MVAGYGSHCGHRELPISIDNLFGMPNKFFINVEPIFENIE